MISRRIGPELGLPERGRAAAVEVDDTELEALEPLWPSEASSATAFARKRLREFRAGRQVARQVLSELGLERGALEPDGDGVPVFPTGIAGSITHTGRHQTFAAAVVLPDAHGVGVDAEVLRELGPELASRIFSAHELAHLAEHGPRLLPLVGFSAKEAYYKCVYPRLRQLLDFHDVSLALEDFTSGHEQSRGTFLARSARAEGLGGPTDLRVHFAADARRVLCLSVWE